MESVGWGKPAIRMLRMRSLARTLRGWRSPGEPGTLVARAAAVPKTGRRARMRWSSLRYLALRMSVASHLPPGRHVYDRRRSFTLRWQFQGSATRCVAKPGRCDSRIPRACHIVVIAPISVSKGCCLEPAFVLPLILASACHKAPRAGQMHSCVAHAPSMRSGCAAICLGAHPHRSDCCPPPYDLVISLVSFAVLAFLSP